MLLWYLHGKHLEGFCKEDMCQSQKMLILGSVALDERLNRLCDEIGEESISCIMDWDESVWGTSFRGIPIVQPTSEAEGTVLSHEFDWKTLNRKANALGYENVYFFMTKARKMLIEQYMNQALPLYERSRIPDKPDFKYVHWIPTSTHFLAVVEMIEYGMNPEEHFFIIHDSRGQGSSSIIFQKVDEWQQRYHNIYLEHGRYPIEPLYEMGLYHELAQLDRLMEQADKIIFHSELPIMGMDEYLRGKADVIGQKGILILWSDITKADRIRFVEQCFGNIRALVITGGAKNLESHIKKKLRPGMLIHSKVSYARMLKQLVCKVETKENVLICHSGGKSNCAVETLEKLSGIEGKFNVYAILSYGSVDSIREIEARGVELFGERFVPIKEFMEYNQYIEFLSQMDVAVFGMNVMAGRDTIELLFWLGVKVYLKPDFWAYSRMKMFGYRVADYYSAATQTLEELLHNPDREWNRSIAAREFDPNEKVRQWRELYEYDFEQHEGEV